MRRPEGISPSSELLQPGFLGAAEDAARPGGQDEKQEGDRDDLLVGGGQDPDAEGFEYSQDHAGAYGGRAVPEPPEDGDGEPLDRQRRSAVVLDVGDRADDGAPDGADPRAQPERKRHHGLRADAADPRAGPVRRAGPHLAAHPP